MYGVGYRKILTLDSGVACKVHLGLMLLTRLGHICTPLRDVLRHRRNVLHGSKTESKECWPVHGAAVHGIVGVSREDGPRKAAKNLVG